VIDASNVMLTDTDVGVKVLWARFGVLLDLFNIGVDASSDLLLNVLKLSLCGPAVFKKKFADDFDGVAISADLIDLLSSSVGDTGVTHGVTVVSVGDQFNEERALSSHAVFLGKLHCLTNDENILSVDLEAWDGVSSGIELGVVRSTLV